MTEYRGKFCNEPWRMIEVHANGKVFPCCPRYSDFKPIGNVFSNSADDVWNSPEAIKYRQGILDGSFTMCDKVKCPRLSSGALPDRSDIKDPYLRFVIDHNVLTPERFPAHVKLAHDISCNLSCPSCRSEVIVAKRDMQLALDRMLDEKIMPFLSNCTVLDLAGDGDPFASKHYRDILTRTAAERPNMAINLHTNGVLCDKRSWDELRLDGRVQTVLISIDAAREATYSVVRRNGDFRRLQVNLEMLAQKKAEKKIDRLDFAFVVQQANYKEMSEFVALARRYSVNRVHFSLIYHWGRGMILR